MHDAAMEYGKVFFKSYAREEKLIIVDVGSQDINGSLRDVAPKDSKYIGLDFVEGKGVDMLLKDPYKFPLPDNYADIVVSSSCFEHTEFFWLSFLEQLRILKPSGILYINAPSNGLYHTHPTDNWRFYPDSSKALNHYANTMGYNSVLLESFVGKQYGNANWNDYVAVFLKDKSYIGEYKNHIYDNVIDALKPSNIWLYGNEQVINKQILSEDSIKINESNHARELSGICINVLVVIIFFLLIKIFKKKKPKE